MDDKINNEEKKEEKHVALTVRLPKDVYEVIEKISALNGVPKASVCRLCIDNRAQKYLQDLVFIDKDQGEIIHKTIYDLNVTLSGIRLELKRIGINYNQEVRLQNISNKYAGIKNAVRMEQQIAEVDETSISSLPKDELSDITDRIEMAIKEAGLILCTVE